MSDLLHKTKMLSCILCLSCTCSLSCGNDNAHYLSKDKNGLPSKSENIAPTQHSSLTTSDQSDLHSALKAQFFQCDPSPQATQVPFFTKIEDSILIKGFGVELKRFSKYLEVTKLSEQQKTYLRKQDRIIAVAGTSLNKIHDTKQLECLFAQAFKFRTITLKRKHPHQPSSWHTLHIRMRPADFLGSSYGLYMQTFENISKVGDAKNMLVGIMKIPHFLEPPAKPHLTENSVHLADGSLLAEGSLSAEGSQSTQGCYSAQDSYLAGGCLPPTNTFAWMVYALDGMHALVIDLRDNTEGSQKQATQLLHTLMPPQIDETSPTNPPLTRVPVVVLVNNYTQGAAAFFATSISLHGRGIIIHTGASNQQKHSLANTKICEDSVTADILLKGQYSENPPFTSPPHMYCHADAVPVRKAFTNVDDLGYRKNIDFALLTHQEAKRRQKNIPPSQTLLQASLVAVDYSLLLSGDRPGRYAAATSAPVTIKTPSNPPASTPFVDHNKVQEESHTSRLAMSLALKEYVDNTGERSYEFLLCEQSKDHGSSCLSAFRSSVGEKVLISADLVEKYSRELAEKHQSIMQKDVLTDAEEQRIVFKSVGRGVFASAIMSATNPVIGIGSIVLVAAESGGDVLAGIPGEVHQDVGVGKGLLLSSLGVVVGASGGVGIHKGQEAVIKHLATSRRTANTWIGKALSSPKMQARINRFSVALMALIGVKLAIFSRVSKAVESRAHPFSLARHLIWPQDSLALANSWADITTHGQHLAFSRPQSHRLLKHLKTILEQQKWIKKGDIAYYCLPSPASSQGCLHI